MKQHNLRRAFLGMGVGAVLLLSPVFWLLPYRGICVGNVSVATLPYPLWTVGAWKGHEADYSHGFSHRRYYMTQRVYWGALVIKVRGREVPDMWE